MTKRSLLFLILIGFISSISYSQSLVINEFMSSNSNTIADEDGDFNDWIELYNPTNSSISLEGYGLSDRENTPYKWTFPQISIPAKSWFLVWASGKDRNNPQQALHTNFSISASGETLILTHPSGTTLDLVPATALQTNQSYGRKPDGSPIWNFFFISTPGTANTTQGFAGIAPDVVFSHSSGFFSEGFQLQLSSPIEGGNIYYTLDGSEPNESSILYTGPISITDLSGTPNDISMIPTNNDDNPGPPYYEGWQPPLGEVKKANVVRAIVVAPNYLPGKTLTHSYLVDPMGSARYSLPVFFLNTNRNNLFDPEIGIYVPGNHNNMFQNGSQWERPMHLEFFEKNGQAGFSQNLGMRLHGGTTRSRPRKTIRVIASETYQDETINYALFPEKNISNYKTFLLRNSGNDWDQSIFRDGFMQYLARELNVETQYYRPAILFINGEYWGINNIRDRYDADYFQSHYGLAPSEITGMENNALFDYGNETGQQHYIDMRTFITNNSLASESNYEYVKTLMDTRSFTDAWITNIFVMNTDWPGNNLVYWRRNKDFDPYAPPGLDGRWRWAILDTDFGFGLNFFYVPGVNQGAAHNTLELASDPNSNNWPNPKWSTLFLRKLLGNNEFRNDFINRFADLLNTTFKEENVISVIDSIQAALEPEMQEHINRWRRPVSLQEWHDNLNTMRLFAAQRPGYMRQHIRAKFSLSGTYILTLQVCDPQKGSIRVNTIQPDVSNDWSGIYFRGIPISLEAIPRQGYIFSHWSTGSDSQEASITLSLHGNTTFKAHFKESPDFQGDELNPAAYPLRNGDYFFGKWREEEKEGNFPPHMLFLQSSQSDPRLETPMTHRYHLTESEYHPDDIKNMGFPYKLSSRTRINALGEDGISFINTGRERDLGAAVLAIDTREMKDIKISWTAATLIPNSRFYAIRLQAKIGPDGNFADVLNANGKPLEYYRNMTAGHEETFQDIALPAAANNQAYLQLRWKYYYTGNKLPIDDSKRDMLRLDNILVKGSRIDTIAIADKQPQLLQNYPNPAIENTSITFILPEYSSVRLQVFDNLGRLRITLADKPFPAGHHNIPVNLSGLESGIYYYQLATDNFVTAKKMMVY